MATHKLDLGDFDDIDYYLIAIHTSLEDYRLAYFINQQLPINLSKSKEEVQINIKEGETNFSRFYYYDTENAVSWNLIQNKNEVLQKKIDTTQNLFSNVCMEISTKVYLLPEFKKADYFLKIENTEETMNALKIKTLLNKIESISTVYSVDTNKIKSKNNLIF
ncbi:MAG: IPExxxVDY family protein [Flavobacteriaceae bacterium]|uniref:IPExxxVDY family protein n=1 Tax=Flavobacterium kayseriense TaxID=2764714 RepID=A0ABR7J4S1_9FLAO|nr:IPExxxVDY family protein [Flavobacterium kayseriense]MBC5840324.1 IPExxxVDY family protein [Flavobacterium kayseriense]MBC5847006.1 IPExxxVDY family protein [Flavobacterium kayseriense]MBX9888138.1 IPExxxVDY family protein [Flavobacteriaceae bacterium]